MRTSGRSLGVGAYVALAAVALTGCAGEPPEPAPSAPLTGGSTSAAATSAGSAGVGDDMPPGWVEPELWWIVEEHEDDLVLAGAGGTQDDGTSMTYTDQQVPLETEEFEVHVYCTPVGAHGVLRVMSQRQNIDCRGTDEPQILNVSAEGAESSTDVTWQLQIDHSVRDWQQAVVILPAES